MLIKNVFHQPDAKNNFNFEAYGSGKYFSDEEEYDIDLATFENNISLYEEKINAFKAANTSFQDEIDAFLKENALDTLPNDLNFLNEEEF